jgi:ACS family hexuronate transporter-like MFS transporter
MIESPTTTVSAATGFKIPGLRWWIIGLVFLATLINYIDRLTISVLAPEIIRDLHLDRFQSSRLSSRNDYLKRTHD